jgi:hypothetical protein
MWMSGVERVKSLVRMFEVIQISRDSFYVYNVK